MRTVALPFAAWLAVLQAFVSPGPSGFFGITTVSGLIATAGVLTSLTIAIYRLGGWHQDIANAKDRIATGIARIERQLEAIDLALTMIREYREQLETWQSRTERRLHRLETEEA